MDSIEAAFEADSALVFGVGGSGDVVGTLPTARLLESRGVETVLGDVAWERFATDPTVGPRLFDEIEEAERVSGSVAMATSETRAKDGLEFAETHVARVSRANGVNE